MIRAIELRPAVFLCALLSLGRCLPAQTGILAVLPNGREIHPVGNWIPLAPYPFAIAVAPDGREAAIPSIGFPFALNLIEQPASAAPSVHRFPPVTTSSRRNGDAGIEVHDGVAYSPDGSMLWVASGDSGKILAYHTRGGDGSVQLVPDGEIPLDGPTAGQSYSQSFAATVVASPDGKTLYVLDQGNWRIVVVDAGTRRRIASMPTGRYPMMLALSPDGAHLYVTNTGLFEYTTLPGVDERDPLRTGLHFPPFGYPSRAARDGTVAEGRTIPGLGDENSVDGSSLWTWDVTDPSHPALTARLHLGALVSEDPNATVGGSAPTGVAADAQAVFVTLAHDDELVKLSPDGARVLAHVQLSPFSSPEFGDRFRDTQGRPLRGVMPSGVAVRDGQVYVAESGIDAVAVLDAQSLEVKEHIPVGWNPTAVALSPDGRTLYVVNAKGEGAGPNGGKKHRPGEPTYVGALEYGSLSAIPLANLPPARELTNTVTAGNLAAIDTGPPLPKLLHCFLVIRENRTFDEVLGDLPAVNGDPSLARYGMDGWAQENPRALHLRVTPNLHALARRFAISDNFYVDSESLPTDIAGFWASIQLPFSIPRGLPVTAAAAPATRWLCSRAAGPCSAARMRPCPRTCRSSAPFGNTLLNPAKGSSITARAWRSRAPTNSTAAHPKASGCF